MPVAHWLQLALARGLGPVTLRRLLDAAGDPQSACGASIALLQSIEGVGPNRARQIHAALIQAAADVPRHLEQAASLGVKILAYDDPSYPALLRNIHDPPPVLFVKGDLEPRDLNTIAIVGSRGCTYYGREQAARFAANLATCGFTIASGGARGVDSAAHRGALADPAGRTIAVLGCGVDVVYPPENDALFQQIAQRGAILSEYPLGTQPLAEHFPRRNRIVSGMSRGVLVIEADEKSGALITANIACEQGRMVFALPGRIDNKMSTGPNKLIREGATLVTGVQDLIDGLTPLPADVGEPLLFDDAPSPDEAASHTPLPSTPPVEKAAAKVPLTAQQESICTALSDDSTPVDTLIERTGLPAHIILRELTMLSLKGMIQRVDGQSYCRRN